jgi:hypothetical protein
MRKQKMEVTLPGFFINVTAFGLGLMSLATIWVSFQVNEFCKWVEKE